MAERLKTSIAAVLFDFDGTLTRPGGIDYAAIKRAIGCPPGIAILEFLDQLTENPRRESQAVLERYEAEAAAAAQPNEGAEDLICWMRARGIPMGLLTRNSRNSVCAALANFERVALEDFAVVITRADVARPKPHPEGVRLAAERLRLSAAELAVVGDYRYDIEAGRQAGALTFFLTNGSPPPPDLAADVFLQSLHELPALLAGACGAP